LGKNFGEGHSYKGSVEIYDPATGNWVAKGPKSSFFPDSWSRSQVLSEVQGAFKNSTKNGNRWEGVSPSGVKIAGYLDSAGEISTAYPIY
jgi:filamentous hemagglutinin